ncbi:SPOR domain-containing protein [Gammaproteobacteria bacterium]|nr:SPOR domain-containing protein [Gammaproteobacteria bacterium]
MKTHSQEKIVLCTLIFVLTIVLSLIVYMRTGLMMASNAPESALNLDELLTDVQPEPTEVTVDFSHAIQLGAFTTEAAAHAFLKQMTMVGVQSPYVLKRSHPIRFVVAVGKFQQADQARSLLAQLQKSNIEGFVIQL